MTAYVVAFASDKPLANFAAFIAKPRKEGQEGTAEGFELTIDSSTNEVLYSMEMEALRVAEVVDAHSISRSNNALTDWHLVQPTGPDVTVTAVCVKLLTAPVDDEIDALLDGLDNSLAVLASRYGGSLELHGSRYITIVFIGNRPALGLALLFVRKVLAAANKGDIEGLPSPL